MMGHSLWTMTARCSGEVPIEDVRADFFKKFGDKIVVLENMENEVVA
jgi:hypothetical protein